MKRAAALLSLSACAAGHGAIISPRSRNSVDYLVGINSPKHWPSDAGCANITGDACHNGQAAFYYSQGCFIGCSQCDHMSGRRQVDLCGSGKVGTLPKQYRSVNLDSEYNSDNDIYKHNPWRSPGNAPTGDACGLAGGTPWLPEVGEAGDYSATEYAHHGMKGTDLPPMDRFGVPNGTAGGVDWTIGSEAEVTFQIENNHGGGYQWRLCPADSVLTEDCFRKTPLDFVQEKQGIVLSNGTVLPIAGGGVFVSEGTTPAGSTWSRLPIPSTWLGPRCIPGPNDTDATPNKCLKGENHNIDGKCVPCPGTAGSDCSRCDNGNAASFAPPCDGCQGNRHDIAVRDVVKVPAHLPPGKYVLGWRWDCEATAQVWNSCSDVTLVR